MIKNLVLLLSITVGHCLNGQIKIDNKMLFGEVQGAILNFESGEPIVENYNHDFKMFSANSSVSDENGALLFYSNGCHIYNNEFEIMLNGDSLSNQGGLHTGFCGNIGSPLNNSVISLPRPNHPNQYFILHNDDHNTFEPGRIYMSIIDMTKDGGKGEVILKNKIIVEDFISRSGMAATKHSNGLDWWVLFPIYETNCYYRLLVSNTGINIDGTQCLGHIWSLVDLQGDQTFSPDGKTYSRFVFKNGLNIFDFNNSTGLLSNPLKIDFDFIEEVNWTGVSISPNSRFLYATAFDYVFQYDLQSEDIPNSRVLVGTLNTPESIIFKTRFFRGVLGPNGKIYIGGASQFNYLHTIHYPDCKGLNCTLEQYAIKLDAFPGYSRSGVPYIPHFRNEPSNIDCDTVQVSVSINPHLKDKTNSHTLFPNPSNREITISMPNALSGFEMKFYDLLGYEKLSIFSKSGSQIIDTSELPPGMYLYNITMDNHQVGQGKFLKVK